LLCLAALAAPLWAAAQQIANQPPLETLPTIVLVLPGENTVFGRAAEAVRTGFFAAHAAGGAPMAVEALDVEPTPTAVAAAIDAAASRGARLIVGPLTRDAVDALVRAGGARLPVLALNTPSSRAPLPPSMLALSLRVEDEARSLVRALLREPTPEVSTAGSMPFAVVTGNGALERRAGAAFSAAVRAQGGRAEVFNLTLNQEGLAAVSQKLEEKSWRAILLALNAGEAAALRPWLPQQTTVVATSRVHLIDASATGIAQELEGLAFVDMPWLVEPDHPAVMVYPRSSTPYTAELERLYALGIDAYRVAAELLKGNVHFEVDGVTGWLRVDPALGGHVERTPVTAVFVNGKAERRDVLR
jgi:outer membrane PBP1 activator LpoA protein